MRVKILYHDRCFDGAASASLVARFLQDCFYSNATFLFQALAHSPNFTWRLRQFEGHENAIVDFRYCPYPQVTWWFDHHQSAFLSTADEHHYLRTRSDHRVLDASYSSCTRLIADSVRQSHGYTAPDLEELITWADIIDGAKYPNAEAAMDVVSPVARLKLVIEQTGDRGLRNYIVKRMRSTAIAEIAADPRIGPLADWLCERRLGSKELLLKHAESTGNAVLFDLSSFERVHFSKFLPYYLFPGANYVVCVTKTEKWVRISLGSNPWQAEGCSRNLATLAERFGGGGHPRVAGITMARSDLDEARALARRIVSDLDPSAEKNGSGTRQADLTDEERPSSTPFQL